MMRALICVGLLVGLGVGPCVAWADVLQEQVYRSGATYVVRTALGITTQIVLVPDDPVSDYSVGFSGGWDVSRRDNAIYVRPKNVDVDTNLIVRTRSRTYVIDLKVVASQWKKLEQAKQAGVHYRVSFVDPPASARGRTPDDASTPAVTPRRFDPQANYHFAYDAAVSKGGESLRPANVYDDGKFTFLLLQKTVGLTGMTQPAVFARRTADGSDMIVNSHIDGDSVVIHGVYPFLALRNEKLLVLIRRNPSK